jgi:hypothetical protein
MYIHIYIVCIYIYKCTHIHIDIYTYVFIEYIYIYSYMYIYIYIYAHIRTHIYIYICMYVCVSIHAGLTISLSFLSVVVNSGLCCSTVSHGVCAVLFSESSVRTVATSRALMAILPWDFVMSLHPHASSTTARFRRHGPAMRGVGWPSAAKDEPPDHYWITQMIFFKMAKFELARSRS